MTVLVIFVRYIIKYVMTLDLLNTNVVKKKRKINKSIK